VIKAAALSLAEKMDSGAKRRTFTETNTLRR
jgi:hypothetical protein